jgi:hypothetical protein
MENPYEILKLIKNKSWETKKRVQSDKGWDFKFLSTYAVNDLLQEPKDWTAIATRVSNNKKHKFFGKDPDWILQEWRSKGKKGQDRGMTLDTYIGAKLNKAPIFTDNMDEIERAKCQHFDQTYDKYFDKLPLVGQEVWLTSELGINVRLDALLLRPDAKEQPALLICEWKNNENLSKSDQWNRLLGPASHLEACDWVKMTFQIHIYRFILEEYGITNTVGRIFQYTKDKYEIHKPAFPYSKDFIQNVIEWCFEERDRRKEQENEDQEKEEQ